MKRLLAIGVALWLLAAPAWAQLKPITDTLQSAQTGNADGDLITIDGYSSLSAQVTISGTATVNFEGTQDQVTWSPVACIQVGDTAYASITTATSTMTVRCNVAGLVRFRARTSGNTGTVTVTATSSPAVMGSGGGGSGGAESQGLDDVIAIDRTYGGAVSAGTAPLIGSTAANTYWAPYYDPTDGLQFVGICAGVVNDCNYARKLAAGKVWELLNSSGVSKFRFTESTGALTNVTFDTEGSGNTFTYKRYLWRPGAACNNATASTIWDLPTSNPAVPACRTGTNTTKGVLEFADGANALTAQLTEYLNEDWSGAIDATILWQSGSTSTNNVVWQLAIACAGDADADDPAFTDDVFTADANKATANQYNATAANTITTTGTCTAGDLMHIRVKRDPAHASDNFAATAQLVGVSLKLRETQ